MAEPILYEVRDHAAWITLNAPERHNALSHELAETLAGCVAEAQADDAVRMIVLTGAGKTFCAGADLKAGGGGAVQADSGGESPYVRTLKGLWFGRKPVIGRIQGSAFAGGIGLVAACDFPICVESARFAFTEVRLGLIPAMISVLVLRKMALADATPLFLTGERFSAEEALRMKLVTEVVPDAELDAAVEAVRAKLMECGPNALGEVRDLLRTVPALDVTEGIRWAHGRSRALFESEEGREGMAAFAEKRKPRWAP